MYITDQILKFCFFLVLSNGCGSNSPLTPSARISALNIVSDLLRKVGVSHSFSERQHTFNIDANPASLLTQSLRLYYKRYVERVSHLSPGQLSHCLSAFVSLRLWSLSLRPAGTLPRNRGLGRFMPMRMEMSSTATRQSSPSHSTRRTLTKRE